MLKQIPLYAKAVAAFFTAAAGSLGTAAADGTITGYEWVGVILASVVATVAVFATPNRRDVADV